MNSDENGDVSSLAGPAHGRRSEQCATPRCRGPVALTYLGRELCWSCWQRLCEQNENPNVTDPAAAEAAGPNCVKTKENPMPKKSKKKTPQSKAQQSKKPRRARGKASGAPRKRLSALDAAAEVLKAAGKPMTCRELITAMSQQGLWTSPQGKTPHATLYSALLRELKTKGASARFRKTGRGLFALQG